VEAASRYADDPKNSDVPFESPQHTMPMTLARAEELLDEAVGKCLAAMTGEKPDKHDILQCICSD
jgi:hypothetical protein